MKFHLLGRLMVIKTEQKVINEFDPVIFIDIRESDKSCFFIE